MMLGFMMAVLTSQSVTKTFSTLIHGDAPGEDFDCRQELFDISDKKVIDL